MCSQLDDMLCPKLDELLDYVQLLHIDESDEPVDKLDQGADRETRTHSQGTNGET